MAGKVFLFLFLLNGRVKESFRIVSKDFFTAKDFSAKPILIFMNITRDYLTSNTYRKGLQSFEAITKKSLLSLAFIDCSIHFTEAQTTPANATDTNTPLHAMQPPE